MRKLIFIPLLLLSLICSATNYYVKTGGDDGAAGTSDGTAWATIDKVNTVWAAGTFAPDDTIFFNRGDTFTGTITVAESGTDGHTIVVSAYGTGADPIITSFTTLSSWVNEGGGIYSKTLTSASSYISVSVDGVNTAMGRWPDSGTWNTIDSFTSTTLTDSELNDGVIDWDGADVVIRLNNWYFNKRVITDHTGSTLTYAATYYDPVAGWGYFIQNHLSTLDATNEWYFDNSDLHIFGDPSAKTVKASTLDYGVVINSYDYITFDNLDIQGYNIDGFSIVDSKGLTVQNCKISFCANNAFTGSNETSGDSDAFVFDTNEIEDINNNGILLSSQWVNSHIVDNTLKRVGLIFGNSYSNSADNAEGIVVNLSTDNTETIIEYNQLDSIGYSGVDFIGSNVVVRYNLVTNFCMTKDDGGGIYTYNSAYANPATNGIIRKNIVLKGIANREGTKTTSGYTAGIYTDGYSEGITVDSNTVSQSNRYGYLTNACIDCFIENNTFYNNAQNIRIVQDPGLAVFGDIHENLSLQKNIVFSKAATHLAFYYSSSISEDLSATATMDYNYYLRPADDDYVFQNLLASTPTFYTLTTWRTYRGQDANSAQALISIADTADIDFYYNPTKTDSVVTLPYASVNHKGDKYAANITLTPFTSAVLMRDPTPAPPPTQPVVTTSAVTIGDGGITLDGGGNVTDDGGSSVTARGVCWNTTGSPTIDADDYTSDGTGTGVFTSVITGIVPNTTYYIRAYATNESATGYGYQVVFTTGGTGFLKYGANYLKYGTEFLTD